MTCVNVEIEFAVFDFDPQQRLGLLLAVEVGFVGQFKVNLCAFENLENSYARVARNHLDKICGLEISLEVEIETDEALEFRVVFQRRCDEVEIFANGLVVDELCELIRPVDDVVESRSDVEIQSEFNSVELCKDACHVKRTAAEQIAEVERKCFGVVGEVGDLLVHFDVCVCCLKCVRFVHIGVTVAVGVDAIILLSVINDFLACAIFFFVCTRIIACKDVLQVAVAREALEFVLVDSDEVAVVVNRVERARERSELIVAYEFSVLSVLFTEVVVARNVVKAFVNEHIDAVNVGVQIALICGLS